MNEHDIMRALNDVDDDLISRYTEFTPKKGIKVKRIVQVSAAVAAAAALAIPAGVYAYNTFLHKENVEFYLSGSDRLEGQGGYIVNHVMENEHLRMTIDTQLSDGHNVIMIETREAKDETGENFLKNVVFGRTLVTYADNTPGPYKHSDQLGDMPYIGNTRGFSSFPEDSNMGEHAVILYRCDGIDLDKDLKILYYANPELSAQDYFWKDIPEMQQYAAKEEYDAIENWLEGFEYVTNFSPNVDCVTLHSENGTELYMSEFELFTDDEKLLLSEDGHIEIDKLYFITNNGEKKRRSNLDIVSYGFDYIFFGEIIDLNDYAGVELYGVEYLK